MAGKERRYDFDRVFRLLIGIATALGSLWLLAYLSNVLVPFAIAVLLAYLLNPLVSAFESKTSSRGWAVGLTLAMVSVFLLTLVPLLAVFICGEIVAASEVATSDEVKTQIFETVQPWLQRLHLEELQQMLREYKEQSTPEEIQETALALADRFKPALINLTGQVTSFVAGVFNAVMALTAVIIVLLYLVFLMLDFKNLQNGWKSFLPPQYRDSIVEFVNEFSAAMSRYFRGQFLVALCCGVLFALGFRLVGLRMAILLGICVGLMNMVPYLQAIGLIPALLLALLKSLESGSNLLLPVGGTLLVFAVVQLIQDAVLVPKIMGKSTGLQPWVILLSIFVWGKLLGFLGVVLAIPLSCLGLAYYRRFILKQGEGSPQPVNPAQRS